MGPSDMFGELSVFDPGPRTSTATAVTDVRAVTMDRDALQRVDQQASGDRRAAAAGAGPPAAPHQQQPGRPDLHRRPGPGRQALLELAQRFGHQEGGALRVTHDLTQEEIAQLVGASRETVNKALADFAHRGWIRLEGKSVLIQDSERLARLAR